MIPPPVGAGLHPPVGELVNVCGFGSPASPAGFADDLRVGRGGHPAPVECGMVALALCDAPAVPVGWVLAGRPAAHRVAGSVQVKTRNGMVVSTPLSAVIQS